MSDDLTLQRKLFQTDCAAQEKDICPSECVHTEGRQRMELSKDEHILQVGFSQVDRRVVLRQLQHRKANLYRILESIGSQWREAR